MPLAEVIYASPSLVKLSGLTAADMVEATCSHCNAKRIHNPWQLHLLHQPNLRLDDLIRNLLCPRCGEVGARNWTVMRAHFAPEA